DLRVTRLDDRVDDVLHGDVLRLRDLGDRLPTTQRLAQIRNADVNRVGRDLQDGVAQATTDPRAETGCARRRLRQGRAPAGVGGVGRTRSADDQQAGGGDGGDGGDQLLH